MEAKDVYRYLQLEQFSIQELEQRYDAIAAATTTASQVPSENCILTKEMIHQYLERTITAMEKETTLKMDFSKGSYPLVWKQQFISFQSQQFWNFLHQNSSIVNNNNNNKDSTISKRQFVTRIQASAKAVDFHRLWPLTLSMLMVGSTVGVTTPAMVRITNVTKTRSTPITILHTILVLTFNPPPLFPLSESHL
jgi:hypothetical protein